jgi:hypothetical protein
VIDHGIGNSKKNNFMPTLSKGLEQRGRSESGADYFSDVKRLRPTQGKDSKITDYIEEEE